MLSFKQFTLLALLSSTKAVFNGSEANEDGMIEMDMSITQRPKQHLSGYAHEMMVLDSQAATTDEEKDYINKQLYDYNNIQIYSKIYIGS